MHLPANQVHEGRFPSAVDTLYVNAAVHGDFGGDALNHVPLLRVVGVGEVLDLKHRLGHGGQALDLAGNREHNLRFSVRGGSVFIFTGVDVVPRRVVKLRGEFLEVVAAALVGTSTGERRESATGRQVHAPLQLRGRVIGGRRTAAVCRKFGDAVAGNRRRQRVRRRGGFIASAPLLSTCDFLLNARPAAPLDALLTDRDLTREQRLRIVGVDAQLFREGVEVPLVVHQFSAVVVDDVCAHAVQEERVVRDHHDRRVVQPHQVIAEPVHRLEVQVVRRFVKQQHVRLLHHRAGDQQPHPPPTTQFSDRHVPQVLREHHLLESSVQLLLGSLRILLLHEHLALGVQLRVEHLRLDVDARHRLRNLRHATRRDQVHQRGFARSVPADDPVPLALPQLESGVLQEHVAPAVHQHQVFHVAQHLLRVLQSFQLLGVVVLEHAFRELRLKRRLIQVQGVEERGLVDAVGSVQCFFHGHGFEHKAAEHRQLKGRQLLLKRGRHQSRELAPLHLVVVERGVRSCRRNIPGAGTRSRVVVCALHQQVLPLRGDLDLRLAFHDAPVVGFQHVVLRGGGLFEFLLRELVVLPILPNVAQAAFRRGFLEAVPVLLGDDGFEGGEEVDQRLLLRLRDGLQLLGQHLVGLPSDFGVGVEPAHLEKTHKREPGAEAAAVHRDHVGAVLTILRDALYQLPEQRDGHALRRQRVQTMLVVEAQHRVGEGEDE
mmetsp:Transcript_14837/g.36968  ORF Transcript_14837/g.36968 Transcript_14837/m.36968 type:complete len:716 (+) Transcript_14837:2641-4788(+)